MQFGENFFKFFTESPQIIVLIVLIAFSNSFFLLIFDFNYILKLLLKYYYKQNSKILL